MALIEGEFWFTTAGVRKGNDTGAETGLFRGVATGLDQRHPASEGHAGRGPKGWMESGR